MITHPEKVAGFLNMDGFAAPFSAKGDKFSSASRMYKVFAALSSLGVIRPFLALFGAGLFSKFATETFPVAAISAQMNQRRFWLNTSLEFKLMISLAEMATKSGWGGLDILRMSEDDVESLARARPACNGDLVDGVWTESALGRSKAELGASWLEQDPRWEGLASKARQPGVSPLGAVLANIPTRVMSARDYNYFGGDSFYDLEMKKWAAAEHSLHAIVARNGRRYVFPALSHQNIFLNTAAIVQCMKEIDESE
jgi:hypothetical protein